MTTPIKNIAEVANNQVNQYLTVNQALRDLEAANFDIAIVDLSDGSVTLTSEVFDRAVFFRSSGNTVARDLTIPQSKSLFVVNNDGSDVLTVKRGASSESINPGSALLLYSDGTTDGLTVIAGGVGVASAAVVSASSSSGVLDLSAVTADTITVSLTENITSITLPAGASGLRKDLMIRFQQDATGGRTVALSGFSWSGDGIPPTVSSGANSVTYVTAVNLNNVGWEAFK